MIKPVDVPGWPRPRGYANGMVATGRVLHVAGQIGWMNGTFTTDELAEQFSIALDNVITIVRAAGGSPELIADMTVFVTDLDAYRRDHKAIGAAWRARMGTHYPAMALIGVSGLVEPRAKVEITAVAYLEG